MELVALITIAILFIVIFIYLILTDTDCLQIMKQIREIARLRIENDELREVNKNLRSEHDDYLVLKNDYKVTLRSVKLDLENIQAIVKTTDKETLQERYIATRNLQKDLDNKIKELDELTKTSSSK